MNNEPAFPITDAGRHPGMSLRDYFAAQAMQAFIAQVPNRQAIVSLSYEMADAMLEERNQKVELGRWKI